MCSSGSLALIHLPTKSVQHLPGGDTSWPNHMDIDIEAQRVPRDAKTIITRNTDKSAFIFWRFDGVAVAHILRLHDTLARHEKDGEDAPTAVLKEYRRLPSKAQPPLVTDNHRRSTHPQ